jgi:hypothetical protein
VTTEAEEIQRKVSASVRDMLDAYRIQASAGPVTDKALEEILFRAAHGVLGSLRPYSREQRVALLPSVVRLLLAAFIEEIAATDQANLSRPPGGTAPCDHTPAAPRRHRALLSACLGRDRGGCLGAVVIGTRRQNLTIRRPRRYSRTNLGYRGRLGVAGCLQGRNGPGY